MSIYGWINPNFWYQLRFLRPHKLNGKWHFIKRDIALPYNYVPVIERREVHMQYNPPLMARWYGWIVNSGLYRRTVQSVLDHLVYRLKPRGNCLHDYVGSKRRKIRYAVFAKNKDPYCYMLQQARNLRMRHWRSFGWSVPERHGPGAGLGYLPTPLDYPNKITRMTEDDWTDTGVNCFALKMFPTIALRKYFNELPRPTSWTYGVEYTKEDMFNHIAWGIDPGHKVLGELLNPSDPEKKAQREEEIEIKKYLWPELRAAHEKDYKPKWPYPDDNIYRPTYNRGFTRQYWSREF
jgi:hypothetical protein